MEPSMKQTLITFVSGLLLAIIGGFIGVEWQSWKDSNDSATRYLDYSIQSMPWPVFTGVPAGKKLQVLLDGTPIEDCHDVQLQIYNETDRDSTTSRSISPCRMTRTTNRSRCLRQTQPARPT
jgi:hypothetical protein